MRKLTFNKYRFALRVILIVLFVSVIYLTLLTEQNKNLTSTSHLLDFAVQNHTWIMASIVASSLILGFLSSNLLYATIEKKEKASRNILEIVYLFMHPEEKEILDFLVKNKGEATQAEISRLPRLNRVKAFRLLQKMQEKDLVSVDASGKVRKVRLKDSIRSTLLEIS